jgi:hypothetical protein
MDWLGIARAVLGVAAVLSVPCSLSAGVIHLQNTFSNGNQMHRNLPGSAAWLAARATMQPVAANGQAALKVASSGDAVLTGFAATPEPLGTGPSLQVSLDVVPSTTAGSDQRTVGAVLYKTAASRQIMRPASTDSARYETIDGSVRQEKHEEILGGERDRGIRSLDSGPLTSGDGISSSSPEPSTFALLGIGLLFLLKRGVRGRCI